VGGGRVREYNDDVTLIAGGLPSINMARARRPDDWDRDLANARDAERLVAIALSQDELVRDLRDDTAAFDLLDFGFTYRSIRASLDVKEKRQSYSRSIQDLWPRVDERDLFIIDETVYRRMIWQGGGGYLAIHDLPKRRWLVFGPWELTLGRHVRYGRWGARHSQPFLKGKVLFNLATAAYESHEFDVGLVLRTIDESHSWRDRVEPYPIRGQKLPELGNP
jgi:hypothetical protein